MSTVVLHNKTNYVHWIDKNDADMTAAELLRRHSGDDVMREEQKYTLGGGAGGKGVRTGATVQGTSMR